MNLNKFCTHWAIASEFGSRSSVTNSTPTTKWQAIIAWPLLDPDVLEKEIHGWWRLQLLGTIFLPSLSFSLCSLWNTMHCSGGCPFSKVRAIFRNFLICYVREANSKDGRPGLSPITLGVSLHYKGREPKTGYSFGSLFLKIDLAFLSSLSATNIGLLFGTNRLARVCWAWCLYWTLRTRALIHCCDIASINLGTEEKDRFLGISYVPPACHEGKH